RRRHRRSKRDWSADVCSSDLSTAGPAAIEAAVARLDGVTAHVVDAPVSGGAARAATGDLLIMVGGAEADVAAVRPLLDALAANRPEERRGGKGGRQRGTRGCG